MTPNLPGLLFEPAPRVLDERLPRMDIPLFVGFARRGPVDRPVPCDDVAQCAAVFGPPHALYHDLASGMPVHAQLARAVSSFFANGGRRCWVLRVAQRPAVARMPLPGLWCERPDGWRPASAWAASAGRWGFDLAVQAQLQRSPLAVLAADVAWDGGTPRRIALDPASGALPEPGELLRFVAPPQAADAPWARVVAFLRVGAVGERPVGARATRHEASVAESWWFGASRALPAALAATLFWPRRRAAAFAVEALDPAPADAPEMRIAGALRIPATVPEAEWPVAGQPLRLHGGGREWLATLHEVTLRARDEAGDTVLAIVARGLERLAAPVDLAGDPLGERLRLSLATLDPIEGAATLDGLGFCPAHPQAWQGLPPAEARWSADPATPRQPPRVRDALWRRAAACAFPLAGLRTGDCLPIGLAWQAPLPARAVQDRRSPLARDGLRRQSETLFLDPRLSALHSASLVAAAEALRFPVRPQAVPAQALRGVHALLAIEEATLVAAPDAGLAPWRPSHPPAWPAPDPSPPVAPPGNVCGERHAFAACLPAEVAPPVLTLEADPLGRPLAAWTADPLADRFVLQGARHPDWRDARTVLVTGASPWRIDPLPSPWRYLRVRIAGTAVWSGWSAGLTLPMSPLPGWVAMPEAPEALRTVQRVQRAMMRTAAARGDALAVLAAPAWMDDADTLRHLAALRREMPGDPLDALAFDEGGLPGYAAFYHPWLHAREGEAVVPLAPEGPATGVIARRTLARGAWIAPANEALVDVLGLATGTPQALQLFGEGVNLLLGDGLSVHLGGARTLSREPDWRALNVRRLASLLRRLLLREGQPWVFEPNGAALERAAERALGSWLAELHRRGAFAGRKPAEAWQLRFNPGGDRDRDAGRFVVELRYAPAQPLEFLVIRLLRGGERLALQEA